MNSSFLYACAYVQLVLSFESLFFSRLSQEKKERRDGVWEDRGREKGNRDKGGCKEREFERKRKKGAASVRIPPYSSSVPPSLPPPLPPSLPHPSLPPSLLLSPSLPSFLPSSPFSPLYPFLLPSTLPSPSLSLPFSPPSLRPPSLSPSLRPSPYLSLTHNLITLVSLDLSLTNTA